MIQIDLNNREHAAAIAAALEKANDGNKYWVSVHTGKSPISIMFARSSDIVSASGETVEEAKAKLTAEILKKNGAKLAEARKLIAELEGASAP